MRGTMFLLDKPTARTDVPNLTLMVAAPERIAALLTDQRVKDRRLRCHFHPSVCPRSWPCETAMFRVRLTPIPGSVLDSARHSSTLAELEIGSGRFSNEV